MQHFAPYMCPVQLTLRGEVEPGEPPATLPTVSDHPRSLRLYIFFSHIKGENHSDVQSLSFFSFFLNY